MKNKIPGWPALWRIGNSKATKSSGLWLILIPIAAKSISQIQELEEKFAGSTDLQLALVLALPFRWKLLYASAVFIFAATLLYHLYCPSANKCENYSAFTSQGKVGRSIVGMLQLILRDEQGYRHLCNKGDVLVTFLRDYMHLNPDGKTIQEMWKILEETPIAAGKENEAFWYVWHFAERTKPISRCIIFLFYILGFICLLIVFLQGMCWVLQA